MNTVRERQSQARVILKQQQKTTALFFYITKKRTALAEDRLGMVYKKKDLCPPLRLQQMSVKKKLLALPFFF